MITPPVLLLFSSAASAPCRQTREVLAEVKRLVPRMTVLELDLARDQARAKQLGVHTAPTIVILDPNGVEVFRMEGVPTINQVLVHLAAVS